MPPDRPKLVGAEAIDAYQALLFSLCPFGDLKASTCNAEAPLTTANMAARITCASARAMASAFVFEHTELSCPSQLQGGPIRNNRSSWRVTGQTLDKCSAVPQG